MKVVRNASLVVILPLLLRFQPQRRLHDLNRIVDNAVQLLKGTDMRHARPRVGLGVGIALEKVAEILRVALLAHCTRRALAL